MSKNLFTISSILMVSSIFMASSVLVVSYFSNFKCTKDEKSLQETYDELRDCYDAAESKKETLACDEKLKDL